MEVEGRQKLVAKKYTLNGLARRTLKVSQDGDLLVEITKAASRGAVSKGSNNREIFAMNSAVNLWADGNDQVRTDLYIGSGEYVEALTWDERDSLGFLIAGVAFAGADDRFSLVDPNGVDDGPRKLALLHLETTTRTVLGNTESQRSFAQRLGASLRAFNDNGIYPGSRYFGNTGYAETPQNEPIIIQRDLNDAVFRDELVGNAEEVRRQQIAYRFTSIYRGIFDLLENHRVSEYFSDWGEETALVNADHLIAAYLEGYFLDVDPEADQFSGMVSQLRNSDFYKTVSKRVVSHEANLLDSLDLNEESEDFGKLIVELKAVVQREEVRDVSLTYNNDYRNDEGKTFQEQLSGTPDLELFQRIASGEFGNDPQALADLIDVSEGKVFIAAKEERDSRNGLRSAMEGKQFDGRTIYLQLDKPLEFRMGDEVINVPVLRFKGARATVDENGVAKRYTLSSGLPARSLKPDQNGNMIVKKGEGASLGALDKTGAIKEDQLMRSSWDARIAGNKNILTDIPLVLGEYPGLKTYDEADGLGLVVAGLIQGEDERSALLHVGIGELDKTRFAARDKAFDERDDVKVPFNKLGARNVRTSKMPRGFLALPEQNSVAQKMGRSLREFHDLGYGLKSRHLGNLGQVLLNGEWEVVHRDLNDYVDLVRLEGEAEQMIPVEAAHRFQALGRIIYDLQLENVLSLYSGEDPTAHIDASNLVEHVLRGYFYDVDVDSVTEIYNHVTRRNGENRTFAVERLRELERANDFNEIIRDRVNRPTYDSLELNGAHPIYGSLAEQLRLVTAAVRNEVREAGVGILEDLEFDRSLKIHRGLKEADEVDSPEDAVAYLTGISTRRNIPALAEKEANNQSVADAAFETITLGGEGAMTTIVLDDLNQMSTDVITGLGELMSHADNANAFVNIVISPKSVSDTDKVTLPDRIQEAEDSWAQNKLDVGDIQSRLNISLHYHQRNVKNRIQKLTSRTANDLRRRLAGTGKSGAGFSTEEIVKKLSSLTYSPSIGDVINPDVLRGQKAHQEEFTFSSGEQRGIETVALVVVALKLAQMDKTQPDKISQATADSLDKPIRDLDIWRVMPALKDFAQTAIQKAFTELQAQIRTAASA